MTVVDAGHGPPIVIVPGIQGRWEYIGPAVEAVATRCRVLTFPLAGERGSGRTFQPAEGFENYCRQVDAVLDSRGLASAVVCGISFGGLVALRFAATRPSRTRRLVLVSTPGPRWHLTRRHEIYARAPWLFGPFFLAETPHRLRSETVRALPDSRDRRAFARWQIRTLIRAPVSLSRMAARARLMGRPAECAGRRDDCSRIAMPTLLINGEPGLDHVVSVDGSTQYAGLIFGAQCATLEHTGHLGCVTRPGAFAELLTAFAMQPHAEMSTPECA